MRLAVEDGVRLHVTDHGGSGPTVLLVHGYPDTSRVWDEVVRALLPAVRVVSYDVRGAGSSDRPARRSAYRIERLARDLVAVADAVSPDAPVHVVGHDWGAIQSFGVVGDPALATRVASFTCVSGASFDHAGHGLRRALRSPRDLGRALGQLRRSWYIGAFQLPGLPELAYRTGTAARILEALEAVPPRTGHPASTRPVDGATGVAMYRANIGRVAQPGPGQLHAPTCVVVGAEDPFVSLGLFDELAGFAPEAFLQVVPGGGHWLPRTHAEELAATVLTMVERTEQGTMPPRLARLRLRAGAPVDLPLTGRLAVVTGAANGIGRQTAIALAERGASLALVDLDADGLARTAAFVDHLGRGATTYVCDVSDADALELLAKEVVADLGVPAVVVNNAGIGMTGPFLDTSREDWERIVGVNLWGVVHGARLFAAAMVAAGTTGTIVNVASGLAYTPARNLSAYVTTKAAVQRLSEVLATELGDHGIDVHAVCPGIVDTGITARTHVVGVDDAEQQRQRDVASALYRRRAYPPDRVAAAVVDAVGGRRTVLPVGPEAAFGWWLSRIAPETSRRLAGLDVLAHAGGGR